MEIFFDHQAFSIQDFGGISRYITELIKGLNADNSNRAHLSLLFSNNTYLKEAGLPVNSFFFHYKFPKKRSLLYKINQQYCKSEIKRKSYDIFHATYYDPYFLRYLATKPFVVTFHDMIHEKFIDQYKLFEGDRQFISHKKLLAEKATHIIAVSESTKKDIVEILNINPNKIQVIYHGNSLTSTPDSKKDTNEPYLLYVGNRQRYKNFDNLLLSIESLLKKNKLFLICAGGGAFDLDEQILIQRLGVTSLVKHQYIENDEKLYQLYSSAMAFVFPSKYEGFGIPILEAFACKCPCIVSNSSSLPEVAGDAALYFDPNDNESIKKAIEQVITNDLLRNTLIDKGIDQLSKFSWTHTVHKTLEVYKSCM